jgi:hypothetical protein
MFSQQGFYALSKLVIIAARCIEKDVSLLCRLLQRQSNQCLLSG